jgi:hypothetical protein
LRQPYGLRTLKNKKEAISFAAYRAVVNLFHLERKLPLANLNVGEPENEGLIPHHKFQIRPKKS